MCINSVFRLRSAVPRHRLVLVAMFALTLPVALPPALMAQRVDMQGLEVAVVKEDWEQVAHLLEHVTADPKKSPDPVLRLIKGHACLALNRNNESVCLLRRTESPSVRTD